MTPFVDSHTHLADPAFDVDADQAIDRARSAGAVGVICIGETLSAARRAEAISARYPGFVWFTAGIHPHEAEGFDPIADPVELASLVSRGAVAVGECGLDYHYDNSPRSQQRRVFGAQLSLAGELGRPVVVHTRDAEDDTIAMVREAGAGSVGGVLHCFTGSHRLAEAALEVGWYISFSGIITFKRWADDPLLRLIPADRLLVESDAPYLAPVPHRGARNQPAWVSLTVQRLADARGVDSRLLGGQLTDNAARLFGLAVGHQEGAVR